METYECLVNHIFLPPRLPQSDDGVALDVFLKATLEALDAFRLLFPAIQHAPVDAMAGNLTDMRCVHINGFVNEERLGDMLVKLPQQGGTIPLHIAAQNAGLLISKFGASAIRFEVFELSPLNKAVYGTQGRLQRSFPGYAADIDLETFQVRGFVTVVTRTLAKLSHQPAPGMQPQVKKSGVDVDEDRDTPHPGMVSEFLMGFLSSVGHSASASVIPITKNTRDEVMWDDFRSPWRRSPAWLLVRVTLQLNFARFDRSLNLYKVFMVFLMSQVLKTSQAYQSLSSDLRYAMMMKVSRRLLKLGPLIHGQVLIAIEGTLQDTTIALKKQWSLLQAQDPIQLSRLSALNFEKDGYAPLPDLDEYLKSISIRQKNRSTADFQPTSGLMVFSSHTLPQLIRMSSDSDYINQNLNGFELWVDLHIDKWSVAHKSDPDTLFWKPEAISIMLLTIIQLWVALDVSAVRLSPLLGDYKPDLPLAFAQNLLLPSKTQTKRLCDVERYVANREARARVTSAKVFYETGSDCFAARYFDQSPAHQSLLATIRKEAEQAKNAKIAELGRQKVKYERLIKLHRDSVCQYFEDVVDYFNDVRELRHSSLCQKCVYSTQGESLRITIHEWPLPAVATKQKVVVFELQPPTSFAYWRDSVLYLVLDVLKADHAEMLTARAAYPLSQDDQLSIKHFVGIPSQRLGLLSQDKPHSHTHRKDHVVSTATQADVCLPNGLNYKYYDNDVEVFVSNGLFQTTDKVPLACTYKLPPRSATLQRFIFRPATNANGQIPNMVIASLSDCPDHMSLDEYRKLSSLPYGYNLQWPNLLAQLGFPAINFKKVESTLVMLQCIYQAGPVRNGIFRAGHAFLDDQNFASELLDKLRVALQRIKENWESSQALSIFISIGTRLLSFTCSTEIQYLCMAYLELAREIAFGWVQDLQEKSQLVKNYGERTEYLLKRAEIALICVDSFNMDNIHLDSTLTSSVKQASILVQCIIIIQESKLLLSGLYEPTIQLLLLRFHRLLHRCYCTLASNHPALDDGIRKSWIGFGSGAPWTVAVSDHWLTTTTVMGSAGSPLRVHFNVLSGELLVNGLPLDRLPRKYEDHSVYRTLFGNSAIEVMPTEVPGMDFAAKQDFSGYRIQFGMTLRTATVTNDLLIQASRSGKRYELIPTDLFHENFPAAFIDEYVHWFDMENGVLEFRPIQEPWNAQPCGIP